MRGLLGVEVCNQCFRSFAARVERFRQLFIGRCMHYPIVRMAIFHDATNSHRTEIHAPAITHSLIFQHRLCSVSVLRAINCATVICRHNRPFPAFRWFLVPAWRAIVMLANGEKRRGGEARRLVAAIFNIADIAANVKCYYPCSAASFGHAVRSVIEGVPARATVASAYSYREPFAIARRVRGIENRTFRYSRRAQGRGKISNRARNLPLSCGYGHFSRNRVDARTLEALNDPKRTLTLIEAEICGGRENVTLANGADFIACTGFHLFHSVALCILSKLPSHGCQR